MLSEFFEARNIAIVGVSRNPNKIGHVIFRNFIDTNFPGNISIVNPKGGSILSYHAYRSILEIEDKIDLAIIAIPAKEVIKAVKECAKKRIKNIIIISAGFKEIGNEKLEQELEKTLRKHKIQALGPNCLGLLDTHSGIDTLFLPRYRMKRPKQGSISFISQSGIVGCTLLDLMSERGYGFSKFISYGNAVVIDESDILQFLADDPTTKVICLYLEGIKEGKKFLEIAKKIKKPIIAIKGGITEKGSEATISHTGTLAGNAEIYKGAFKQTDIILAESLEDMFNYARILEACIQPKGNRVQIITNGGGYGVITADALNINNLTPAQLSKENKIYLKKIMPPRVIISNPIDLLGDTTTHRYKHVIETCMKDKNIDIILLLVLYQTPLLTTSIIDVITEFNDMKKKPIIVVSTGGEFTKVLKKSLEENNIPCFDYPEEAVRAIKKLTEYYGK